MQAFKEMVAPSKTCCTLVSGLAETERWMSDAIVKLLRLNGRPMGSKEVGEALCIPQSRAERHMDRLRVAGAISRQRAANGDLVFFTPRTKPY
jgi:predicted transcriptional regulator